MTSVEVTAHLQPTRSGGWNATVPGWDCEAHSTRLDKLRLEIAQQIHEDTGVELCDIVIRLEGVFPDALRRFHQAHDTLDRARSLQEQASKQIRDVVRELRDENLTMRDISALLGITPQRVAQLSPCESTPPANS